MKRLSLTSRLSLLFMLAVVGVLSVAGLAFARLSHAHFAELDHHSLADKLEASRSMLGRLPGLEAFERIRPQLSTLLGAHRDISATLVSADGQVLFAEPTALALPARFAELPGDSFWQWQSGERAYHGMTGHIRVAGLEQPLTMVLALDVTRHQAFFDSLQRWFWLGLLLSALASAGLGWLAARSGLRPLRQLTRTAASISPQSLSQRIPSSAIPQELQALVSAFNAMLARLDEAFVRLSNFSADIAHELRTPVGNLMTHTEVVLSRPRSAEDYQDNLHGNLEELRRMARMIDDMLFLAKADNRLIIPQCQPVRLEAMVEELFEYYRLLAEEQGVELRRTGQGEVQGDPLMLRRAVANLLSNALRHTPPGETVTVRIDQDEAHLHLSVENPGETIDAEHLQRLFDRFYRIDPARREGSPGNVGLGLAITQSIVQAHQGRLWCRSSSGVSTFHIELPRSPRRLAPEA